MAVNMNITFFLLTIIVTMTMSSPLDDHCSIIADKCERQQCIFSAFAESLEYPTNLKIIKGEIEAPGLSANVSGRFSPSGQFDGIALNNEYFYGIAAGSAGLGQGYVVTESFIIYSICENDLVAGRIDILFKNFDTIPSNIVLTDCLINGNNLTISGVWQFDEDGTQIISYDVSVPTVSAFIDRTYSTECSVHGANFSRTAADSINGICLLHDTYCTNADNQYGSIHECVTYLKQKEFGDIQKAKYDTVYCRFVHSLMVHITPKIHCNHIGPESKVCIARNYSDWYQWHGVNYDTNHHGNKDISKPQSVYHGMMIMCIVLPLILKQ